MKKIRVVVFTVCFLMLMAVAAYAHGDMITVYKTTDNKVTYKVIPEEQLVQEKNYGWTSTVPASANTTKIPMYSADGRVSFYEPNIAAEQSTVGWHYSPRKLMYSADRRKITVPKHEITAYENVGWYIEPVGLMKKESKYRWVIKSEIQEFRNAGWMLQEYSPELYGLATQMKNYLAGKKGQYGVYVKNLKTDEYMVINDNRYAAASIIKLFVMAETYNEIAYGSFAKTDTINRYLNSMITVSDNYSSNYLVKTIGKGNYYNAFKAENAHNRSLGCYNTVHNSLFIGYGDYVSYGKNVVSPMDCGIVLEKIYDRELVSPAASDEMLAMLKKQQRRNKIPYLLPKGTVCANKTGETSTVESDVGIVYSPNCNYIICVTTNNSPTGITDIRKLSQMTYNYFN